MTLYVATLTGKTYDLPSVSLSDTIGGLKRRLQDMEGLPPDFQVSTPSWPPSNPPPQRWIFAGRYLEDGKTVEEVGLLPEGCKERPSIEELPPLAPGDTVDIRSALAPSPIPL